MTWLIVFGDSHSRIWGGRTNLWGTNQSLFPGVQIRHLGAALAFNLLGATYDDLGKWGGGNLSRS
jgi:hypothetical protein